jgi:predicted phosphodiesterase
MPEYLTLLHLSDIHFTRDVSDVVPSDVDGIVRHELVRDAVRLLPTLGSVDGIVVSGDLAFAGKVEEFQTAVKWLAELSEKLGTDPRMVWCVPGNHDVDRNVIKDHTSLPTHHREIRTATNLNVCLQKHLDGKDAATLFEPLRTYNDTVAFKLNCLTSPRQPWWEFDLPLNDGTLLRLRGLNSSIISGDDDHRDTCKLCLGLPQYEFKRYDNVTHLAICHHPMDWLVDGDKAKIALRAYAKIILTGHKHAHEEEVINDTLWLSSGAVHPSRRESDWEPNFYVLQIKVEESTTTGRQLVVRLFRRVWSETERTFVRPAAQNDDFKVYRLSLPQVTGDSSSFAPATEETRKGVEMEINRKKLLYSFVSLPYHTRMTIMKALNLIDAENQHLPDNELFMSCFQKASEKNLLPEIWRAVESRQDERSGTV